MLRSIKWQTLLWGCGLAFAFALMLRSDVADVTWVAKLSNEGSPAPAHAAASPTGYVLGQRQFLGVHERGETYRWIAATQELLADGPFAAARPHADNVPVGRPRLQPRLYTLWLAGIAWTRHTLTGEPLALAAEQAALWEPVLSHALAFAAVAAFLWLRFGLPGATAGAVIFALFPPFAGQFVAGVLTPRTWAILLAAYAVALCLLETRRSESRAVCTVRAAVAAALALWLDPAFGFPAVLLTACAAALLLLTGRTAGGCLKWSLAGAALTLAAWMIDQSPWALSAGELRYVHPLYASAWLGAGLALECWQRLRTHAGRAKLHLAGIALGVVLLGALAVPQFQHDYKGWLYPSAALRRLTSLDETLAFDTGLAWLQGVSVVEVLLVLAPAGLALVLLVRKRARRDQGAAPSDRPELVTMIVIGLLLALSFLRLRWGVATLLGVLPLIVSLAMRESLPWRRSVFASGVVFLSSLLAWHAALPASFQRPADRSSPSAADLEALIARHFAHWLASHNAGHRLAVLAPPEMSDSLVFHGDARVLMSTAWESYPGQVAASRILSALEASEAEAVIQSRELTHVILPSWDPVLPLLVKKPTEPGKDTLYARLQRWVLPRYLRAIPYRLPPVPGYLDQKLAVFQVTPPQDEALALSRLAEYFVEMGRIDPAALVARVLAESFADDPNALVARALVYQHLRSADAEPLLARLAADATAGKVPFTWDRRVQRAITLALGHQRELARTEIEVCLGTASEADLFELTPLQAYRLVAMARRNQLTFPDPRLAELAAALGSEYARPGASPGQQ